MSPTLTFGYLGWEHGNFKKEGSSITHKSTEEPVKTIDIIVKFFGLKKDRIKVDVDFSLVYQGAPSKTRKKEIKEIWKKIISKHSTWEELRLKLLKLLELGESLLPVVFDLKFKNILINVVDGEDTILIDCKDKNKLKKFKSILEKDVDKRITPYGLTGSEKMILK